MRSLSLLKLFMFAICFLRLIRWICTIFFLLYYICDRVYVGVPHISMPKTYFLLHFDTRYPYTFFTSFPDTECISPALLIFPYNSRHPISFFFVNQFYACQISATFFYIVKWTSSSCSGFRYSLLIQLCTGHHVQIKWWDIIVISHPNQLIWYSDYYSTLICGLGFCPIYHRQLYWPILLYFIEVQ